MALSGQCKKELLKTPNNHFSGKTLWKGNGVCINKKSGNSMNSRNSKRIKINMPG